jgi:pimeloyl-ACP methyl ester carboxylesterase
VTDTLLLLHGFPLDGSMWDLQAQALSGTIQVLAPSLPGQGTQPAVGDVMTMDLAARRCLEALAAADAGRTVVCGISMGGYVAFELWRQAPERFAGLVLSNTRSGPDDEAGRERRAALASRLEAEGTEFLVDAPGPLLSDEADEETWRRVRDIIAAQPAAGLAAAARGMAERPDSTGDLARISVPTLVVTSTADALIPPDQTTPMAEQIPGAQLEVIEGVGHLSSMEAPGDFTLLLERHLTLCGLL